MQVPASGMVTALEPIMRACSGVWVAHGAGTADRETSIDYDQVRVPPDDPAYTLRRVWLTHEQEQGYYYGFSQRGYLAAMSSGLRAAGVSRRRLARVRGGQRKVRGRAWRAESSTDSPVILIQDFHFALLPQT